MNSFPTGLKEVDTNIIIYMPISQQINLFYTSKYFRDILSDPYTFKMFKEIYPYCIINNFNEFLILNNEIEKDPNQRKKYSKKLIKGDRFILKKKNYIITSYTYNMYEPVATMVECDILGEIIGSKILNIRYPKQGSTWSYDHTYLEAGILKHYNGPEIKNIDSPYLLYDSYEIPINLSTFDELDSLYPGLLICLSNKLPEDFFSLSYVVLNTGDNIVIKYVGNLKEELTPYIPDIITFNYDIIDNKWISDWNVVPFKIILGSTDEYNNSPFIYYRRRIKYINF
jgi:hypothetical protein